MKSLIKVAAVVAVVAAVANPALSHAQSSQPSTRAQVREQLVQLEKAGYYPNHDMDYPSGLQHAESVVASQRSGSSAYGSDSVGTRQSGN